jgi:two-component sensor histidine kinase
MTGPEIQLPAAIATPLALVIHELATNAAKYGALSDATGVVELAWEKIGSDGARLRMIWSEQGGPAVREPMRNGLGTYLVQKAIPNAEVTQDFRPSGLVCTIEFPLE